MKTPGHAADASSDLRFEERRTRSQGVKDDYLGFAYPQAQGT